MVGLLDLGLAILQAKTDASETNSSSFVVAKFRIEKEKLIEFDDYQTIYIRYYSR